MNGLLTAADSLLLVVDIQERLAPAVEAGDAATARTVLLLEAARVLQVPVVVSEQYPAGLGPSVASVRERVAEADRYPKVTFSCVGDAAIRARLLAAGRRQVVAVGMETHVCVLQSAFGLAALGLAPYIVEDAVASRRASDRAAGLARMRAAGIGIVSAEMVVFEWLERAGSAQFKELSRLVK